MHASERTAAGRFPPGHSGNPAGRPPGSRNKSTLAVEEALAARAGELVGALLRSVHDGKGAALRICFDRIAPLAKGRPVPFALPPLACQADVVAAGAAVVMGMADGELTPTEALDILGVLDGFRKMLPPPAGPGAGRAPPPDPGASGQPPEPSETCGSPGSEGATGDENAEAPDPVPATPDPPPAATFEATRQPEEPAQTSTSSRSAAGAADDNADALDPMPVPPDPPPAATVEARRQPEGSAETSKSSGSAARAASDNAEAPHPTQVMPGPPPLAADAGRMPPATAEICKLPEIAAGECDQSIEAIEPMPPSPAPCDGSPSADAEADRRPREPAETCRSPESEAESTSGMADPPPNRPKAVRTPLFASSSDLIADRRYDRAREYEAAGDLPAAAELLAQALEIAPDFASAWFALGDIREQLKDRSGAIAAFRKAVEADRGDRHGAGLRLVRLGEAVTGEPMSQNYVRALFDQYAPRFEADVVGGLAYRGPQLLRQAVETVAGAGVRFDRMLDLGCGTGLAAETFAPLCRTAVGIDLSPAMIEIARRKGFYVDLAVGDMTERLTREPTSSADLVVAADAFAYLADLTPVCRQAARVLTPGGLLAFSVETHPGGGVILGEKLRYAHAAGHVSAAMDAASLTIRVRDQTSVRQEGGIAVPCLVVVASPARPPHGWGGRGVRRARR